jgi:hypothetical protein
MKKIFLITSFIFFFLADSFAQSKDSYDFAFQEIHNMLKGYSKPAFKRAVFLTENAFHSNKLDYKQFSQQIDEIENRLAQFMADKGSLKLSRLG